MRGRHYFVLGLTLALVGSVVAETGGGFPSRPRFQSVGVGTVAPATSGVAQINTALAVAGSAPSSGTQLYNGLITGPQPSPVAFQAPSAGAIYNVAASTPSLFFIDNSQSANSRLASYTFAGGTINIAGTCPDSGSGCNQLLQITTPFSTPALVFSGSPVATSTSGTFTLTVASGCTTTPTSTATYTKIGNMVTLNLGAGLTCTSNAAGFTASGLIAALQPASVTGSTPSAVCNNNSAASTGNCYTIVSAGSGTLSFGLNGALGGWTASGTKSITGNVIYTVQ